MDPDPAIRSDRSRGISGTPGRPRSGGLRSHKTQSGSSPAASLKKSHTDSVIHYQVRRLGNLLRPLTVDPFPCGMSLSEANACTTSNFFNGHSRSKSSVDRRLAQTMHSPEVWRTPPIWVHGSRACYPLELIAPTKFGFLYVVPSPIRNQSGTHLPKARVFSLYKKGNPDALANFRPISLHNILRITNLRQHSKIPNRHRNRPRTLENTVRIPRREKHDKSSPHTKKSVGHLGKKWRRRSTLPIEVGKAFDKRRIDAPPL